MPDQPPPGSSSSIWVDVYFNLSGENKGGKKKKKKTKHWDVHDAEEQFLCDAQQTRPDGHDQQDQAAEHVEGEVHGSQPWRRNRKQEEQQAQYPLGRGGRRST